MSQEKEKKITYIAKVFGATFVVEAEARGNVSTHLVKRLREELEVRLATFADGAEMARRGIETETAGSAPADLLTGVAPLDPEGDTTGGGA